MGNDYLKVIANVVLSAQILDNFTVVGVEQAKRIRERQNNGSVDIQWGIKESVLWRTALQADTYVFGFIRAHLHFVPMYTGYSW